MPMKKILLVSGCSFTDPNYVSTMHPTMDCSWPKWPELLAKKLDMDCINVAHTGAGNEYIYSSLLDKIITTDNIGLVMAAWTQCQRKDWETGIWGRWHHFPLPAQNGRSNILGRWQHYEHYKKNLQVDGDVFGWVNKSLRYYYSLQEICKSKKIPLKQFQMLSLFDGYVDKDTYNKANRDDPDFAKFFTPPGQKKNRKREQLVVMMEEFGRVIDKTFLNYGSDLQSQIINDWEGLTISKEDHHPNEKGQKVIAEFLYEKNFIS